MGYSDTLIADVLGSERKRLIFCGLETQEGVVMSDSERWLEIEQCNYREQLTSFGSDLVSFVLELHMICSNFRIYDFHGLPQIGDIGIMTSRNSG